MVLPSLVFVNQSFLLMGVAVGSAAAAAAAARRRVEKGN